MPQRPVAPGPGRDGDSGWVEEDWLAWCAAVENQLDPDQEEPDSAAPWDVARLKQDPRWTVDQLPDGTFRWTTPTGRQYTTEPTRYPV